MNVATSTSVCAEAMFSARAASIRMALVRPAALACSPFQRVAWKLLHDVAAAPTTSSTVISSSKVRGRRSPGCSGGVAALVTRHLQLQVNDLELRLHEPQR